MFLKIKMWFLLCLSFICKIYLLLRMFSFKLLFKGIDLIVKCFSYIDKV